MAGIESTLQELEACVKLLRSTYDHTNLLTTVDINVYHDSQAKGRTLLQTSARQLEAARLVAATSSRGQEANELSRVVLARRRTALKQDFDSAVRHSRQYARRHHLLSSTKDTQQQQQQQQDGDNGANATAQAKQMVQSLNRSKIVVQEILESTAAANSVLDEDAESLEETGRIHGEYGSTMSKASSRLAEMKRLEELANTRMKWSFGLFVCVWLFVMIRRLPFLGMFMWVMRTVVPRVLSLFGGSGTGGENQMESSSGGLAVCIPPQLQVATSNFAMKEWPSSVPVSIIEQVGDFAAFSSVCVSLTNDDAASCTMGIGKGTCFTTTDTPFLLNLESLCGSGNLPQCSVVFASCCGGSVVSLNSKPYVFTLDVDAAARQEEEQTKEDERKLQEEESKQEERLKAKREVERREKEEGEKEEERLAVVAAAAAAVKQKEKEEEEEKEKEKEKKEERDRVAAVAVKQKEEDEEKERARVAAIAVKQKEEEKEQEKKEERDRVAAVAVKQKEEDKEKERARVAAVAMKQKEKEEEKEKEKKEERDRVATVAVKQKEEDEEKERVRVAAGAADAAAAQAHQDESEKEQEKKIVAAVAAAEVAAAEVAAAEVAAAEAKAAAEAEAAEVEARQQEERAKEKEIVDLEENEKEQERQKLIQEQETKSSAKEQEQENKRAAAAISAVAATTPPPTPLTPPTPIAQKSGAQVTNPGNVPTAVISEIKPTNKPVVEPNSHVLMPEQGIISDTQNEL